MTIIGPILCLACARLDRKTPEPGRCAAYPKAIPVDILGGADHHTPRGDEKDGLVFEKRAVPSADVVLEAWHAMRSLNP